MKPNYLLRTFVVCAIALVSFTAPAFALECNDDCSDGNVKVTCDLVSFHVREIDKYLGSYTELNSETQLRTESARLKSVNQSCGNLVQACLKCPNIKSTTVKPFPPKEVADARKAADDRLLKAKNQLDGKPIDAAKTESTKVTPNGVEDYTATFDATDSGSTDSGGGNYSGGDTNSNSSSSSSGSSSKANDSSASMKSMMPLMQMALQMMAAKQAQQQQQQASCGGPNPAPGCPPQHICFTNPSSLECKCGPYGPGGPECGRPQLAATERFLGNPIEKEPEPPPPSTMTDTDMLQAPEIRPGPGVSTAMPGGGGGGSLGNNPSTSTPPKKGRSGGGGGSLKELTGARGFMGASPYKGAAAVGSKEGAGSDGKGKRQDPRFDPSLQGAQAHYGRMLQAGMENARRRTAGTRQMVTSKEVRPASDNLFKAVNEAYQAKDGTFLR